MTPQVGDYCEMLEMPGFHFKKPMWAQLVESDRENDYKMIILCGGYNIHHGKLMRRGDYFYLMKRPENNEIKYRYYREAEVPDLIWAAISAEVLLEGPHNERN